VIALLFTLLVTRPDPVATPGALNPAISFRNQATTICAASGWTTNVIRPPSALTTRLKREQLAARGWTIVNPLPTVATRRGLGTIPDVRACVPRSATLACYEEDHLVPLTLGGHPTAVENLWPQPILEARLKDRLEQTLHRRVCAGLVDLADAQRAIATDWHRAYRTFIEGR
jgi:hypothetical protein